MRRLFRWAFRLGLGLLLLAVAGVVAIVLLRDDITRKMLVNRLRSKTGMAVNISAVHVGLRSPTITIKGVKLYNTPAFGSALCLDMPELHLEYELAALRARRLHLTLLRLDLEELSVLQDKNGRNNFNPWPTKNKDSASRTNSPGLWEFTGIDVLHVIRLGKFRLSNMATGRGEEIDFGITNQILRNVQSEKDLAPLGLATFSHGKATATGDAGVDLSKLFDNLLEAP
jgi:uncharacterized protein involved in outer membrane biogenesis